MGKAPGGMRNWASWHQKLDSVLHKPLLGPHHPEGSSNPILQMGRWGPKELLWLALHHMAASWQSKVCGGSILGCSLLKGSMVEGQDGDVG